MRFTVCTATYNRAHTLERVFTSLLAQTERDFEWVIIDDGSTDNTAELIGQWKQSASFPIRYEFQTNQGKHIAVNRGAQMALGELFVIADSDDTFFPKALETFLDAWMAIPESRRHNFTGVTGLCVTDAGEIIGDKFPQDVLDTTALEVCYRYNIAGEKWGFHRTDVIQRFPSPSLKGLPFFAESIIWHRIGRKYKTRFINKPVRIYKQDAGNQITTRSPKERSPARIFYAIILNDDHDYLFVAPRRFFKSAVQGVRFSLHQSDSLKAQFSRLDQIKIRLLWALAFAPGLLLYLSDVFNDN